MLRTESKRIFLAVDRVAAQGLDALEEHHEKLKMEVSRLESLLICCNSKLKRIEPFTEEFETVSEKIIDIENKIESTGKEKTFTRVAMVSMKREELEAK